MPKRKVKVPETLDFVKGLLISADEISEALSGELEPRKVLAQQHTKIARLTPERIQDLGMYQGRVVLVALAAELALKFAWERENQGGATDGHTSRNCMTAYRIRSRIKSGVNTRDESRTRWKKSGRPLIKCSTFAAVPL